MHTLHTQKNVNFLPPPPNTKKVNIPFNLHTKNCPTHKKFLYSGGAPPFTTVTTEGRGSYKFVLIYPYKKKRKKSRLFCFFCYYL